MVEAAKTLLLVLSALFPIMDPLGGSPFFLALTPEYAPEARKVLLWRIAVNSFCAVGRVLFCGDVHPGVFRDFFAGRAGWRRNGAGGDGLGDADAK